MSSPLPNQLNLLAWNLAGQLSRLQLAILFWQVRMESLPPLTMVPPLDPLVRPQQQE